MFNKTRIKELEKERDELRQQLDRYLNAEKEKEEAKKEGMQYAFEIDGKKFFNHYQVESLNIVRYEQYQRCLMELESGLGTDGWKDLIAMLLNACNPNEKNKIDLATISYVATEMQWRIDRIFSPDVVQDIFCLYVMSEDEDPMQFDAVEHEAKKKLFNKHGYLNITNDFFLEFLNNLLHLGDMSESELKLSIQKSYIEEMYRDLKTKKVAETYLKN